MQKNSALFDHHNVRKCQSYGLNKLTTKLIFQRPTVSWKLFSGRFINAVMTVHAPSIAEYGCVAVSNNFTLGSGVKQYTSTNSVWKHLFANF